VEVELEQSSLVWRSVGRLIGIVNQSSYRGMGKVLLKLKELKDVLMDVETILNNRLLSCVKDDVKLQELTQNLMIF